MLPAEVLNLLARMEREKRAGTIVLNVKDGRVIEYQLRETHRIESAAQTR